MPRLESPGHFFRWYWGFEGEFVQNDLLDVKRTSSEIRKTAINTMMGQLTLNLWDSLNLYGSVGSSKMTVFTNLSTLYSSGFFRNSALELNFTTAITWDIGFNYELFDWQQWYSTVGFYYFSYYPNLESVIDNSTSLTHYLDIDSRYSAWTLSIGGGYEAPITSMFSVTPYMNAIYGITYVDLQTTFLNLDGLTTIELSDLYSPYMWGYTLGVTLKSGDRFSLTAEIERIMYQGFSITGIFPF